MPVSEAREQNRQVWSGTTRIIWLVFWLLVFGAGLGGWLGYMLTVDTSRAWRAVLINFCYFTPMAAGLVTWPAGVMLANGKWDRRIERMGLAGVAYMPIVLIAFFGLWLARSDWANWLHAAELKNRAWLNTTSLFTRDTAAIIFLYAIQTAFVWRSRYTRPRILAGWVVFAFVTVFTMLGFDLVMAMEPKFSSSLFGGYYVLTGAYTAALAWTLQAVFSRPKDQRLLNDLGKLLLALTVATTYFMYCQLVTMWYENLPEETIYLIPRLTISPWHWVSIAVLSTVYVGPILLLLSRSLRENYVYMTGIVMLMLAGHWVERWWLITPTSVQWHLQYGLTEGSTTAAFGAALILAVSVFRWYAPRDIPCKEEQE